MQLNQERIIPHSRPMITDEDKNAVCVQLLNGLVAEGYVSAEFALALNNYLGGNLGVLTSSGSSALLLALLTLDVRQKEVILPSYVCDSVFFAVRSAGGIPRFADITDNYTICPVSVSQLITSATGAIIAVHTFGNAANLKELSVLGVPIIEDCCQSLGLTIEGTQSGTIGAFGVYSFHATKLLCCGEGGFVTSNDPFRTKQLKAVSEGENGLAGFRLPLSDLQAALGLPQLKRYNKMLERRQQLARRYDNELSSLGIELPASKSSIYFRYPIRSHRVFEELQKAYESEGIAIRKPVDSLLHRRFSKTQLRLTERLFENTFSIPIYPALSDSEQTAVIQATGKIFAPS